MEQEPLDDWFVREVLPHEAVITRYLYRTCNNVSDAEDILQDAYARLYVAAQKERPAQPKAFLFRTARNLIIDRARRAAIVPIDVIADIEAASTNLNEATAEDDLSSRQELAMLKTALEGLPARCQEVVAMVKIEGCSQRETAQKLGISQSTVEKHVAKGIAHLAQALYGEGRPFEGEVKGRGNVIRFWKNWK